MARLLGASDCWYGARRGRPVLVALTGCLLAVATSPAPAAPPGVARAEQQVALHEGHPAPVLPSEFQDRDSRCRPPAP